MATLHRSLNYISVIPMRLTNGQLVDIAVDVKNDDGSVVNVTGRLYTCDIGIKGGPSLAEFTEVLTDPVNGLINLKLDTSTAGLAAGNYWMIAWEYIGLEANQLWEGPVEIVDPVVT